MFEVVTCAGFLCRVLLSSIKYSYNIDLLYLILYSLCFNLYSGNVAVSDIGEFLFNLQIHKELDT